MSFHVRPLKTARTRKSMVKRILFAIILLMLLIFITGIVYVAAQVKNVLDKTSSQRVVILDENGKPVVQENSGNCGMFGCLGDLISGSGCSIKSANERTNFMLLGMGGEGQRQGGEVLTDTMMVASLNHADQTVSMISLPRDLWVKPVGIQPNKINTLYGISQRVYEDKELGYSIPKGVIEDLTGLAIHYWVVVDFNGFQNIVDSLGGIDIEVEKAFKDREYPDGNFGYKVISFEAGPQHMDGATALEYVRSRHGSNGESGDFARSRRQQKFLGAIKDKALNFGTIFKINSLLDAVAGSQKSNISSCEMMRFASLAKDFDFANIKSLVLDDGPGGVLYTPTMELRAASYGGQYILLPDNNNYQMITDYVQNFISASQKKPITAKVAVLNGTGVEGLANEVGALLVSKGINVVTRTNTTNKVRFAETQIVDPDLTTNNMDAVELIQTLVNGKFTDKNLERNDAGADLILILGGDYKKN